MSTDLAPDADPALERIEADAMSAFDLDGLPVEKDPSGSWRNLHRAGFAVAYVRPNLVAPAG